MSLAPVVWEAPPLRGLDARARADLALAATVRRVDRDAVLFRPGDPAADLYVVERGSVVVVGRDGRVLRQVGAGEAFGEEALVTAFASRIASARGHDDAATVVALPAALLRRVWQRGGATDGTAAKLSRSMARNAMRDALATAVPDAAPDALEVLLDGARLLEIARGDVVVRPADRAGGAQLIVDGLVRIEPVGEHVAASHVTTLVHLRSGDVFRTRGQADQRIVAALPTWLVAIEERTLSRAGYAEAFGALADRAVSEAREAAAIAPPTLAADLGRLATARSLLVMDGEACVRCGHCASACADAHGDGKSRLLRHGPILQLELTVAMGSGATADAVANVILPASCQHCRAPACLPACPTGAIARDAEGHVTLREDLCTGCGSCAKACPWDNLALAPRAGGRGAEPGTSADVAVKCDLCHGRTEGPACVAACPTSALVRVDAIAELTPVGASMRRVATSPSASAHPFPRAGLHRSTIAAAGAAAGLAIALAGRALPALRLSFGVMAGLGVIALSGYALVKRAPGARRALRIAAASASMQYTIHVVLGWVTVGAALAHVAGGGRATGAARAAFVAFVVAATTGAIAAFLYRWAPRRLSRLVREEWLPEEGRDRARALEERLAAELSGKSDLVKAVFVRVLDRYRRSPLVRARLFFAPRPIAREIDTVHRAIREALEGRGSDKLEGIDGLVDAVVLRTAFGPARVLLGSLRAALPLHVIAAAAAALVVLLHAVLELAVR